MPNYDYEAMFGAEAQELCEDVAESIVHKIQTSPLTPRRTSRMAEGYAVEKYRNGARITNRPAPYWIDVEYGHDVVDDEGRTVGHAAAQPHVRPAFDAEVAERKLS